MLDFSQLSSVSRVKYVFKYISILIAILGIPCNILTFTIFLRRRFRTHTFSFYMRVTCVVDSIVLAHSFRHWAADVLEANIDLVADLLCRLNEYCLLFVNASVSVWILVLIAFDRLVTIAFPLRFSILKKRIFQASVVTGIYVFSFLLYIPTPVMSALNVDETLVNETNASELVKTCELTDSGENLVYWINMVNLMIAILFVNNILTVMLIIYIFRL